MRAEAKFRPYLVRLAWVFVACLAFSLLFNEAVYLLQKENTDRAPMTIQIVIPAGTAKAVESGQNPPTLPAEMVFVLGDVLEVKNEDEVSHQLGPIWVPSGATGRLVMEQASSYSYSCSFQTSRYLGIDVRQPTTLGTRLTGLMISAPTLTALIYVYSLVALPVGKAKKEEARQPELKEAL